MFADVPEAVTNTKLVADKCDLEIDLNTALLSEFPVPEGSTPTLIWQNLRTKAFGKTYTYKDGPFPKKL